MLQTTEHLLERRAVRVVATDALDHAPHEVAARVHVALRRGVVHWQPPALPSCVRMHSMEHHPSAISNLLLGRRRRLRVRVYTIKQSQLSWPPRPERYYYYRRRLSSVSCVAACFFFQ